MEEISIQSNIRLIIEFCKDIVAAIWEKHRDDLIIRYSELVQVGQIAYFLEALMRDHDENVIGMRLFRSLAIKFGVYRIDTLISTYYDSEKIIEFSEEEGKYFINFSSYNDVIEFCGKIWRNITESGLLNDKYQKKLMRMLIISITPKKIEDFQKLVKDQKLLYELINDCIDLGLIIHHEAGYYYSPKILKIKNKRTLDIITEFNITTSDVIREIEKIESNPAFPIDSIDTRIQTAIFEGAFKGILEPITIKLPDSTEKCFVFANAKDLEQGDLSYETAAHFRFNEVYAIKTLGRLEQPIAFLKELTAKGIAGNATNIGLNYFPLEVKGVIKVVEGKTTDKKRMVSLKLETLKEAQKLLENNFESQLDNLSRSPSWLSNPAGFRAVFSNSDKIKSRMIDLKDLLRDTA